MMGKDSIQGEYDCVTQELECACGCGMLRQGRSKYAHPNHRDRIRNKARITAYTKLLEV